MTFAELKDWQTTSAALHQAAMLLGPIHNAVFAPRTNYLHLPMFIEATGLVSQKLPQGGRLHVNFKDLAISYERAAGDKVHFSFADHTQASLLGALLAALKQDELAAFFADAGEETLASSLMTTLHADKTRVEFLQLEDVTRHTPLIANQQTASDYADLLYSVYTAVARFRSRLAGHMTPIVVWPEHFDLSTLWFHPDNPHMADSQAHLNFGFTPYTPGQYDQPYLYAYAYPYPEPFIAPALPAPAFWHTTGWRGIVVKWSDLQQQADIADFVETIFGEIFDVLYRLIQ